jgi:hypothetical protein
VLQALRRTICDETGIRNIWLTSDDESEAGCLGEILKNAGKVFIDGGSFIHSSSSRLLGLGILLGIESHGHQVSVINRAIQANPEEYAYSFATLALLQALAAGEHLVCSMTTFAPLSILFTEGQKPLVAIPNTDPTFSLPAYRHAPYCS